MNCDNDCIHVSATNGTSLVSCLIWGGKSSNFIYYSNRTNCNISLSLVLAVNVAIVSLDISTVLSIWHKLYWKFY